MVEFLFLDLDDTILDFHKAEHIALSKTLRFFGLEPAESVMARYSQINREHWERLERKELTREQVLVGRFAALFEEYQIKAGDFWNQVNAIPNEYQAKGIRVNKDTYYLNHFIKCAHNGTFPGLNNEKLRGYGTKQKFYKGIPKFFEYTKIASPLFSGTCDFFQLGYPDNILQKWVKS